MVVWLTIIYAVRYTLKLLLMYKGWMYEERGKGRVISARTRIWLLLVKILSGGSKPLLYSYQGSLPRLPLPSLKESMSRVSFVMLCYFSVFYAGIKIVTLSTLTKQVCLSHLLSEGHM
jgi:hypothetical protein